MPPTSPQLRRQVLEGDPLQQTVDHLQACLFDLVDLALVGKQAHWNVVGKNFRSVHLQLDEVIATARLASDEVAERIVTLTAPADGRAAVVAERSRIGDFPSGLQTVEATITLVADALQATVAGLRSAIDPLGDLDPVSQDLLIGISAGLEKHLWMVQAQEG